MYNVDEIVPASVKTVIGRWSRGMQFGGNGNVKKGRRKQAHAKAHLLCSCVIIIIVPFEKV